MFDSLMLLINDLLIRVDVAVIDYLLGMLINFWLKIFNLCDAIGVRNLDNLIVFFL